MGLAVARLVRDAPEGARPLLVARRAVAQHLADALDDAMRAGNTLLVIRLNAQLELAIARAELDGAGGVTPDDGLEDETRGLDDELAELASRAPEVGDPAQA